ncbi:MAG: DUF2029 domain-containing protein [Myxococcales bacterium]|nr:DUF2029 domain-containing protein [Myxococcales bacterium]
MNHFISGIIKIAILEGSCALILLDRLLAPEKERARRIAFALIAGLSVFAFANYGQLRGGGWMVHHWEQFHFYLGAKYQKEVGWFDLYKAVILADRESAHALDGLTHTRDLHTFEVIPVAQALEDAPRVRAKFSDERWTDFKDDWRRMLGTPANWAAILQDHGNSNSPAWAIVAHPIARLLPLAQASQVLIGWLDFALMAILWWFIYRTFELRVASIALTVFAAVPIVFDYLAGSFLRWDWLFATGMCLCFMKRGRWATAGAFFGYAVATKLFPIFFGVALLVQAVLQTIRERRIAPRYLRFGAGAVGSLLAAVIVASAMFGGPGVWLEYKRRIDVTREEKFYANQYSLKTVFLQLAYSSPDEFLSGWAAPREIKQGRPDVDIKDHTLSFLAVQLLFTLLVVLALARAGDVAAFALGPLLVFTWLVVNMYYWNMLGFLALGLAMRKERPPLYALFGLHAILALFYLYQHTNHGYAEGYFVALLLCAFVVAFAAAEAVALRQAGFRPFLAPPAKKEPPAPKAA